MQKPRDERGFAIKVMNRASAGDRFVMTLDDTESVDTQSCHKREHGTKKDAEVGVHGVTARRYSNEACAGAEYKEDRNDQRTLTTFAFSVVFHDR